MELELFQVTDSLDVCSAETILQGFDCNYIFKWKIPGHHDYFMWKKCPYSDAYRLFIIRGTKHTLFADSDLDIRSKYTPFLEEFIIDFKAYSGK